MTFTIDKKGNLIKYTDSDSGIVRYFSSSAIPDLFSYDTNNNVVRSRISGQWDDAIPIADLTIDGSPIANISAFDAAVSDLTKSTTTGGGGGTPGGSNNQIQYNNAGAFGGIPYGDSGQILTSNGTSIPTWEDAPATIYSGDGSLPENRTIDLNDNELLFVQGGNYFLRLDSTVGNEFAVLRSYNITGNGNDAFVSASTSNDGSGLTIGAGFNDGVKRAYIELQVASGLNAIGYNSETHTFNGQVKIVDGTEQNGYVFTSDADGLGSWQPSAGGGATIYTGDGTLSGDRTVDLDGHSLFFRNSFLDYLRIDIGDDRVQLQNSVGSQLDINNDNDYVYLQYKDASTVIQLGSGSAIAYTADTHTFNISATGNWRVSNGSEDLLEINANAFNSAIEGNDGTARSRLELVGDLVGNEVQFNLNADDGTSSVNITGDAQAETITLTSATTAISNLAGTGSRAVVADDNGVLSAPVSDISVKENIQSLSYGIDEIMKLRPVSFTYKDGWKNYGHGKQIGFIAQEIEDVLPNSVFTTPKTGKKGYSSNDIIPLLVKALQEQELEIQRIQKLLI